MKALVNTKNTFGTKKDWDLPSVRDKICFGSISYCCMRARGCPGGRDDSLREIYGNKSSWEEILKCYFADKRELAIEVLKKAKDDDLSQALLELEGSD